VSLYKRGNVWWAYFYIDGVRQQHSTGTGNRKQAEAIEQKSKAEANARRHHLVQADPEITFGALAARFIANGSPKIHHVERLKVLLPYFADIAVVHITKGMTVDYRQYRHSEKTVSEATINRDLSVLRRILYWAVEESILMVNPLVRVKMERERRVRRPVLSLEEEHMLLTSAPDHLRRIIIAALDSGMRKGEVLSQRWEHVDFSRRLLFVTRSKTPEGEAREIPLTTRLHDSLSQHRRNDGIVFVFNGKPIRDIKKGWKRALERAKVRHVRFHDLRHTYNTRLMEAGVLQEVRMALMGHSNRERVHSIYTHIELPAKREAIRKLEIWVNQQEEELKRQQVKEQSNASTKERSESN
jgi:integrase